MAQLFSGTSGYAYPSWKPGFYPADVPAKRFLEHYASRLNSTEINYTFHRLPARKSLEEWVACTPEHFVFSMKAHMRLTHSMRLKECDEFLRVFLNAIDGLRVVGRLGPVLFQLPPNMKCDVTLLAAFLDLLPDDMRFAWEFRNPSWLSDEVYTLLQNKNACLCLAESEKLVVPKVLTADFAYFRLRKPGYTPEERAEITTEVRKLLSDGRDAYVYFKHEDSPDGAIHAEELLRNVETNDRTALLSNTASEPEATNR